MDEDDGLVLGKDDIGLARQVRDMKPEAVTHPVKHGADLQLGSGVLPPDPGHDLGALLLAEDIRHRRPTKSATTSAICLARSTGTAFPTCLYCSVRGPSKK